VASWSSCATYWAGVVQNGRFMGYTESGQSRANQGIPRFACNPDLNHAHHVVLITACPSCSSDRASFGAWTGRQRLHCEYCRIPVEADRASAPLSRQVTVPALQAELLRLASGAASVSLLWADVPADGCAMLVRDLAALLLRPGWDGWGRAHSEDDAAEIRRRGLADFSPRLRATPWPGSLPFWPI